MASGNDRGEALRLTCHASSVRSRATLMRAVDRGELLRLRPGVFADTEQWAAAPPWVRQRGHAAAAGLSRGSSIFCRETALALYGVPLLSIPGELHLRTLNRSQAGRAPGNAHAAPTRRILPPVPSGMPGDLARHRYRVGTMPLRVTVPGVTVGEGRRIVVEVEPLPFVLLDTLPRLSFQAAVMAMDAATSGRYGYGRVVRAGDLQVAEEWLWSRPASHAWRRVKEFSDPDSESAGESRARALFHELGFAAPRLQTEVLLPGGRRRRLDFDWAEDGVIGEFDGQLKYDQARRLGGSDGATVYWEEKWRETEIEEVTGKRFVRMRWDDLNRPDRLARRLLAAGVSRAGT